MRINSPRIRHTISICDVYQSEEQLISFLDLRNLTAEELMLIYQHNSPEEAYAAFNELYLRFSMKVFSFLKKKINNQADAEDLLQKIFIKMHESKHLYKQKFKFEQWLFVIARTAVLDHYRAFNRYRNRLGKMATPELVIEETSITELTELTSLNEDQKEMLEMKYIDELSYQEMAGLLNKSETALRKAMSRLVMNLKKGEA